MHALLRAHAIASRTLRWSESWHALDSAAESLSYLSGQADGQVMLVMVLRLVMWRQLFSDGTNLKSSCFNGHAHDLCNARKLTSND